MVNDGTIAKPRDADEFFYMDARMGFDGGMQPSARGTVEQLRDVDAAEEAGCAGFQGWPEPVESAHDYGEETGAGCRRQPPRTRHQRCQDRMRRVGCGGWHTGDHGDAVLLLRDIAGLDQGCDGF